MSIVLGKARFIPDAHFEREMERHLCLAGISPTLDNPFVDIEDFIDRYLDVDLDQYCNRLSEGELGVTDFRPNKRPLVRINRALTEAADDAPFSWVYGRWRFTLAHEAAHVIFHRAEVEAAFNQLTLFDVPDSPFRFTPFNGNLQTPARLDPREYQANRGASILLMPRTAFVEVARPLILSVQTFSGEQFESSPAIELVTEEISQVFRVSKQAARIRLDALGIAAIRDQISLLE